MEWFFTGLAFAFFNSITMLINQRYKLDGHLISAMRGVFVGIAYLPFLFFVKTPHSVSFWVMVLAEGALSAFFNARLCASSARFGAASTSVINVLSIGFGMLLWWIVDTARFFELVCAPLRIAGVGASVAVFVFGFAKLTRGAGEGKIDRAGVLFMLPAVVVFSVMLVIRKEIMDAGDFWAGAVCYGGVSIFLSGLINLCVFAASNTRAEFCKKLSSPDVLEAGIFMALASGCTILFGNLSSWRIPSPAYLSALSLLSPLFIFAYEKYCGRPVRFSLFSAVLMFAGLGGLLYFG